MILLSIAVALTILILAPFRRSFRIYVLAGLLALIAIVCATVYLFGDDVDRCLDAGGAWSREDAACQLGGKANQ